MKENNWSCAVFGLQMAAVTFDEAVQMICEHFREWKGEYVTFLDSHALVIATEKEDYYEAQSDSIVSFADGYPIAKRQRKYGFSHAERIAGPDVMDAIFKKSVQNGYKHYFYGSNEETLSKMKTRLESKYEGIDIVGYFAPKRVDDMPKAGFDERYREDIEKINAAGADFIWIGLGASKQEYWMHHAKGKINGLMLGVGAGFDFHSGSKKRAPLWMQKNGMEWLFRVLQEPKRLLRRYMVTNFKFMKLCIKDKKANESN